MGMEIFQLAFFRSSRAFFEFVVLVFLNYFDIHRNDNFKKGSIIPNYMDYMGPQKK